MILHTIPKSIPEMAIKAYIARAWPMLPGFALRDVLRKRDVRVNGKRAGTEARVRGGDALQLYGVDAYTSGALTTLFDDGQLMAFVKPVGLPVDIDASGIGADTVLTRLQAQHPEARLVHRLDTGTGGVMLAALNDAMEATLIRAFQQHQLRKQYCAMVVGVPSPREALLQGYIQKNADAARVRLVSARTPGAIAMETRYRVTETGWLKGIPVATVLCEPITGRTHQIRVHMASIDHPLIGDDKYGNREVNRKVNHQTPLLWCQSLTIGAVKGAEHYAGQVYQAKSAHFPLLESNP